MMKKQVTISVYVKEDLKDKFEQVFQESEFNSKGEFLGILLENYLTPLDDFDQESKQKIKKLQTEIDELKEFIEIESNEKHDEKKSGSIVLPTNQVQSDILRKCYDGNKEFEKAILKDLVKMACQFVKIKSGFLFSDDEYSRFFILKDISKDEFETAFANEIESLGGEIQ